jgi:hypothetical protein
MADPQEPGAVTGYNAQSQSAVDMVNTNKAFENDLGDWIAQMRDSDASLDPRWMAIAVTGFQQAFMALNRAVFQPDSRLR